MNNVANKFKLRNITALEQLALNPGVPKECYIHMQDESKLVIECEDESLTNYTLTENGLRGLTIHPGKYSFTLKESHVLCQKVD